MEVHERKRELWFPSDLLGPAADEDPDAHLAKLRAQAEGIPGPGPGRPGAEPSHRGRPSPFPSPARGLPRRRELLAQLEQPVDRRRRPARPGLHDYARDTRILHQRKLEEMQFEYLRAGFHPEWDRDPYRVFAYTTVQERATQFSHSETGKIVAEYEPRLRQILSQVAKEEARHYTFYRTVFEEILKRDPDQALHSASFILPAIDMPGVTMPGFKELADVIRRAGIYGPRDYLRIVQEQIRYWKIESMQGLNDLGRKAQEKIMGIPARLRRIAEYMETRSKGKTFSFEVVFNREFAME